jgi:hypothetical protein
MIYIFGIILIILLLWLFLIWLRKTTWDAVHRNLLDLEDIIDGRVMRRGFASRPVFHGTFHKHSFTINFSTEKHEGKRSTYVDISYEQAAPFSFTIASKTWLASRMDDGSAQFIEYTNATGTVFMARPANDERIARLLDNKEVRELLNGWKDLAYFFAGETGIMYEFVTEAVVKSTEAEALKKRLEEIRRFLGVL